MEQEKKQDPMKETESISEQQTEQGSTSATDATAAVEQTETAEEALSARLAELEAELAAAREQTVRKVADLENYRKRLDRERVQTFETAKTDAISRFLPIYDDLKRSLEAAVKLQVDPTFLEGVNMVSDKFADVLSQLGISRIDEVMVPFNVEVHEALLRSKHDDPTVQPNTVTMILEPGYRMGDKVIRHAKVMVSE